LNNYSRKHPLFFLTDRLEFPDVESANSEGLLAVGGDLSPDRLMLAYRSGIFPWFNQDSPILWWSPDPRMVLFPKKIKVSKSMVKVMRDGGFTLSRNTCFEQVVDCCAKVPREGQRGTWITPEMHKAYRSLYKLGFAHSYEVWQNGLLVGGLYGVDLGHIFCGESMFSKVPNASKFAFISLARNLEKKDYHLIDCQLYTSHLASLGAEEMSRSEFVGILKKGF
jgi:leucyl/phenylalanyl-tRNA--protein transferase